MWEGHRLWITHWPSVEAGRLEGHVEIFRTRSRDCGLPYNRDNDGGGTSFHAHVRVNNYETQDGRRQRHLWEVILIAYHPTAVWNWPRWALPGCQSLVILERLVSYHPAFPFHAWLTLYHIQISGRPLALRTFPFHLVMCICGSTGRTDLYSDPHSVEGRCQMYGWGEGQCSIAVTVSNGCVAAAGLTDTLSCPQAVTLVFATAMFP